MGFAAQYAVYFRAHKSIRYELSPAAPAVSAVQVLIRMSAGSSSKRFKDLGGMATRTGPPRARPTVLFVVVGEAARAASFQLGGYGRPTTPRLASMTDVVYFSDVSACDTSTATSVPCMFSPLRRNRFDVDESSRIANLLDSLGDAGFAIEWRENNAGCKGVCDRVKTLRYEGSAGGSSCEHSYCYDEVMLDGLAAHVRELKTDTAIVFHQIGSHGPAYWERYPAAFERFKPSCRSNELHTCSEQQLVNAYDNTIAYTDHVLSRQIEILRSAAGSVDSFLLYVSDHGESLGENALYLHGMPYFLAPRVQTHVPMLMWASEGYVARMRLDTQCLGRRSSGAISHDNLYHTLLGAAEVYDAMYQPKLDLLSTCRESNNGYE
jgi:lipid A ethanolaminephosphotransferase